MPMQRLTNSQTTLDTLAQGLKSRANSGTMIHVGMIWGWRAISPNPPFSDGRPYNSNGWVKAVVLETDGINDVGSSPDFTGLGVLSSGKMGSTNLNTALSNLNGRLTDVCTAMAADGIVIYTVGLGQGATNTQLAACAANGGQFYAAPTSADLTSAFQAIANSLNNLRLSK
jgi:hypothetical protein